MFDSLHILGYANCFSVYWLIALLRVYAMMEVFVEYLLE